MATSHEALKAAGGEIEDRGRVVRIPCADGRRLEIRETSSRESIVVALTRPNAVSPTNTPVEVTAELTPAAWEALMALRYELEVVKSREKLAPASVAIPTLLAAEIPEGMPSVPGRAL